MKVERSLCKLAFFRPVIEYLFQLWERQGQDVDELVTLFYLPGVQTDSTVYAIGSCMKDGKAKIRYER